MPGFAMGDRVEHADNGHQGTIVFDDGKDVHVYWDDRKRGWLTWDRKHCANAYRLIKLVDPAKVKGPPHG